MCKFKIGDYVECIDDLMVSGDLIYDIKIGETYIIKNVMDDYIEIIDNTGYIFPYRRDRFLSIDEVRSRIISEILK
mgnify:CR=1 FL=1